MLSVELSLLAASKNIQHELTTRVINSCNESQHATSTQFEEFSQNDFTELLQLLNQQSD